MAALNFPTSPSNGDVYSGYSYDSSKSAWTLLSNLPDINSRFYISETAPSNPTNGEIWLNSADGNTYIYYDDGDTLQWIEIGGKTASPSNLADLGDVTITSPTSGESLVYDSASSSWINADATVEVYGVDTAATDYFMIPVGGDADRPVTPANGHIRFNSDSGQPEWYSEANDEWVLFKDGPTFDVEYLVIAGGGSGGDSTGSAEEGGGGGGAGGYRSSVSGETSGGGASAESSLSLSTSTFYTVTIGAGGSIPPSSNTYGGDGSSSVFSTITSTGGGGGAPRHSVGRDGGSGSGGGPNNGSVGGSGETSQGFDGGSSHPSEVGGGGGGGAGQVGQDAGTRGQYTGGNGGNGVASSITGTAISRGGGGGGGVYTTGGQSSGGTGGGGDGCQVQGSLQATAGTVNTGGGGGGGDGYSVNNVPAKAGGSGVVIIKYPSFYTATPSAGLTSITNTVGDYKVTQFTAGTGTVIFS